MNICIVSYGHISKLRGGIDRVTDIISEGLKKKGHTVCLVSVCPPTVNEVLKEGEYQLPSMDICSEQNRIYLQTLYEIQKTDIILNQSERRDIFDLIHYTHNNIPIISCIHSDPLSAVKGIIDLWDERKIKLKWKFYLLYPLLFAKAIYQYYNRKKYISEKYSEYYEKCDAIVLLSEKFKKSFTQLTKIKNQNKLYAINNPYSFLISEHSTLYKEKIVLFVGRLDFQKRVDRLLRIWKRLHKDFPEWKLQIVGDGTARSFYETLCNELELSNVDFLGTCDPEEYYKKATIVCVTSSHEGFCMVITEGMQYKVIPIAFNSFESLTDIITDRKTGFIVKKFSEKQYSQILTMLMRNSEYREEIQNNISEFNKVSNFNTERIVNEWEKLLTSICRK